MIKFFRKIRQNLLSEGKTGKYLKYAFGEIVLVVIGILIALQVNDWNNNRKNLELEDKILKEIYANLNTDLKDLQSQIEQNNWYINHNSKVLEHLINKTPLNDSLRKYYSYLYGYGHFSPKTVGYQNLKSQGISLVKNDSLRNNISELYENKYFDIADNIRPSISNAQDIHFTQIVSNISHKELYVDAEPMNLELLQNNLQFQESLKWIVFARQWTNELYKDGKLNIEKVMEQIKKEMNK